MLLPQKIKSMNPDYVAEKPKLNFRQTNEKTGKKESILKSIFKAIPRMIRHVSELHKRKMQIKKLEHISKQAEKIGADISRMSPILLGIPLKYQICDTGAAN